MIITYSSTLRNDDMWKPAASRQSQKRNLGSTLTNMPITADTGCGAANMQSGDY